MGKGLWRRLLLEVGVLKASLWGRSWGQSWGLLVWELGLSEKVKRYRELDTRRTLQMM